MTHLHDEGSCFWLGAISSDWQTRKTVQLRHLRAAGHSVHSTLDPKHTRKESWSKANEAGLKLVWLITAALSRASSESTSTTVAPPRTKAWATPNPSACPHHTQQCITRGVHKQCITQQAGQQSIKKKDTEAAPVTIATRPENAGLAAVTAPMGARICSCMSAAGSQQGSEVTA